MSKDEKNNIQEDEEIERLILKDENGEDVSFELIDFIELDEEKYVVLVPENEDKEDDEYGEEVVILKVDDSESEDETYFVGVEDEDTLEKIYEIFVERFKDEFDFIDEEEE